jgi:hypothetical protein
MTDGSGIGKLSTYRNGQPEKCISRLKTIEPIIIEIKYERAKDAATR